MNRSGIEWCDHTWNPITGCLHGCPYCYARKMSVRFSGDIKRNKAAVNDYRLQQTPDGKNLYILDQAMLSETGNSLVYPFGFEPTLHRYRFNTLEKLKMGNNIFVGAMADKFGEWVPDEWISEIFGICQKYPIHNYLFLTKNPKRYWELEDKGMLPAARNMWYGFSYTNNDSEGWASKYGDKNNFVSVEPLLEDLRLFDEHILCPAGKWVIIGAETGRNKTKIIPKNEWIDKILKHCDKFQIPVFMKDSLIPIVGEKNMRREFPPQLQAKAVSPKMKKKLYDTCCVCKTFGKKSEMAALSVRTQRGEQPKQFAFMCWNCFLEMCRRYEIQMPELAAFKEEAACSGETEKDT